MIKYLILGSLMERPFHGYDLKSNFFKRIFKDFGINDGQLYPALKKLNQEGLIEKVIEHQEGAPSRHIYSITSQGEEIFMNWLLSYDGEESSFRYEFFRKDAFIIRCSYFQYLDKTDAINKIQHQLDVVEKTLEDLNMAKQSMLKKGINPYRINVLGYGIKTQEARAEWLKDLLMQIENGF
jgi:PadR family transcriptional regulator AphA